jgi:hypothetical protein
MKPEDVCALLKVLTGRALRRILFNEPHVFKAGVRF